MVPRRYASCALGGRQLPVIGTVISLRSTAPVQLAPGVTMRPLFGEGVMLNLLEFEPGSKVSRHSHPHEQLGYVLEGDLALAIVDQIHELATGHAYRIPGGAEHAACSTGGCLVLDVFHPVREDYRRLTETEPRTQAPGVGR